MAGALQPRRFGVWPFNDFLRPPPRLEEPPGGEEKDSGTTAEGPPHVRGDDGDEAGAGVPAERSEGTPKGLARPRSDSAPKGAQRVASEEGGLAGARSVQFRGGGRLRGATTCARGELTHGLDPGSREGTFPPMRMRAAAVGEGPEGAARWVGAGGP
jgi:hypothetical protein